MLFSNFIKKNNKKKKVHIGDLPLSHLIDLVIFDFFDETKTTLPNVNLSQTAKCAVCPNSISSLCCHLRFSPGRIAKMRKKDFAKGLL